MVNLVWKDLLISKRYLWVVPLYGFFAFFAFRTMPDGGLSAATVAVTYMLMLQAITQDDKNKSEIMLNSLPLRRLDIVLAKYLSVFLYAALGILSFLLAQGMITVIGIPISISKISSEEILGALIAMIVMISIYFPIYFKFGSLRSRMVGMFLFLACLFFLPLGIQIVHRFGGLNNSTWPTIMVSTQRVVSRLQTQADWQIASYLLVCALILLAASVSLSLRFYRRREF